MKKIRLVVSSIILSSASALSWAQAADEHNAHHPDATTTGEMSISSQSNPADNALLATKMDTHMKAMHDLHEKLQKASPDERQALMPEHQALMQEGMKMMGMASAGMQGMGMMNNMQPQASKDPSAAPTEGHHTMMLKRMDMMQSMMQMMMDRMPPLTTTVK